MTRLEFLKKIGFYSTTAWLLGFLNPRNLKGEMKGPPQTSSSDVMEPAYLNLYRNGQLEKRADALWDMMRTCRLCPRQCGAKRLEGEKGFCQADGTLEISSYNPHFGEERPLVGRGGSGTVFFTNCSLRCVFCINWEISHGGVGQPSSADQLASMMLALQNKGCHNINVVTPTHYAAHMVRALDIAAARGLHLPLVYNTCGWENIEVLKMLDGIVDIYLPDFKYADGTMAARYSAGARDYPQITQNALLEMQRQVGTAIPGKDGIMQRGLMIRHLVMPNDVSGTQGVLKWIADNLPKNTYVNLMSQYQPTFKAMDYPQIARRITTAEYHQAVQTAKDLGLTNLEVQGYPIN